MKPQVNNLLQGPLAQLIGEMKPASRSTSRTAISKDSERKKHASDGKEQRAKQPQQMILKSQMQALVAQ